MKNNTKVQRLEMYAMISAIENDFIDFYSNLLSYEEIDSIDSNFSNEKIISDKNRLLRSLDLQSFIEIANKYVGKLNFTLEEKRFINKDFKEIIPIRNKVMHPRILEFYDYTKLKTCFNSLGSMLGTIPWNHVEETKDSILSDKSKIMNLEYSLKKTNSIIENIPVETDFEITSFIGRKKEIGKIKELLNKRNIHILTIIGDGGVGKTSLVLKFLYDLLDDKDLKYEVILWSTLKTKHLNNYEFQIIEDAVTSADMLYDRLINFTGTYKNMSPRESLVQLSKDFKTLLVLDNLETINSNEVRDFLNEFSENGKIIITSRIGLGEMEYRYKLEGMNQDDILEYFNKLLEYYSLEAFLTNEEKERIAIDELYSNPLSVKWFVAGLNKGLPVSELLSNKDDLINFCMSNVYENFGDLEKTIIGLLKIVGQDLTFAEAVYLLGGEGVFDDYKFREAINSLSRSNFIDYSRFLQDNKLSITEFAKEFALINITEDSQLSSNVKIRQKTLEAFAQNMTIKMNSMPYSLGTFHFKFNEDSRKVSAFYLNNSLEYYNKKEFVNAEKSIAFAELLCPNYYEINKMKALLKSTSNPQYAKEQYEIAITNSRTQKELMFIYLNYGSFLLSKGDYSGSISKYLQAEHIDPANIYIKLELMKAYCASGYFDEAEKVKVVVEKNIKKDEALYPLYMTRVAIMNKRIAELIPESNYMEKFNLISDSIDMLEGVSNKDRQLYNAMASLLNDIINYNFEDEIVRYVLDFFRVNFYNVNKSRGFNKMKNRSKNILNGINDTKMKKELSKYLFNYKDYTHLLKDDQGIIYLTIKEKNYGFIMTRDEKKPIFFHFSNLNFTPNIGDVINLINVRETHKGMVALKVEHFKNVLI